MTSAPLGPARIRFGPEIFRIQRRGGVSRYIVELHSGLLASGVDSRIVAGWHLSDALAGVVGVEGRNVDRLPGGRGRQAVTRFVDERLVVRTTAELKPADIWHPSYFPRLVPKVPNLAVTVYDMIHERFPGDVAATDRTSALKAAACRAADVIFCISQDTADDLIERLGVSSDRVLVTPLGVRPVEPHQRPSPFGEAPYVVYIGERTPRYKNWLGLLDALRDGPPDLGLLCIGGPPAAIDEAAVSARGLAGRVRFEGGTDAEVAGRLRGALGLVYPSLYEGFGLPPLEALAQGCPVVASRVGAIPEVVGELAIMVEPTVEGIGGGIEALVAGGSQVDRQRSGGPALAARHPWSGTVEATVAGYRRMVS